MDGRYTETNFLLVVERLGTRSGTTYMSPLHVPIDNSCLIDIEPKPG